MTIFRLRLGVALVAAASVAAAALAMALPDRALAQGASVEIPADRQLAASEPMASPGYNGLDYSANSGSLAGLSLLATIPAAVVPRRGGVIQAQCAAGLVVALDDPAGSLTPSLIVLAGAATSGGQGGALDLAGMPHTGRIRIYSSNAGCQMAARAW